VKLTAQEYKLLSYLMHHKGKVVSRTELIEHIYDQDFDRDSNTIEVFVTRIRKKLGADVITTIRGLGYSLEDPEDRRVERHAAPVTAAADSDPGANGQAVPAAHIGSLTRRMIGVAALWIGILLLTGGFALDRVLTSSIVRNFDEQLTYVLNSMIASSEIGPDGEVRFNRPPADQRFIEPYSGVYFQVSGEGADTFPSRSLWDRRLQVASDHFTSAACLRQQRICRRAARVAERDVILPGSDVRWRFQVAQSREMIDSQIRELRSTLFWSFAALGLRDAGAGRAPDDLRPVAAEPRAARSRRDPVRQQAAHFRYFSDRDPAADRRDQSASRAQRGAGRGSAPPRRQSRPRAQDSADRDYQRRDRAHAGPRRHRLPRSALMRRQVDHHLARARAIGRRSAVQARARVGQRGGGPARRRPALRECVTVDIAGDSTRRGAGRAPGPRRDDRQPRRERREIRAGRVFVTVEAPGAFVDILVEDDGRESQSASAKRSSIAGRGSTPASPGTGLGLAIVRDVAEIYGGRVPWRRARTSAGCSPADSSRG
jgi:DNA-binding winged helix-turn-helix (wHTH) protein